jgi:predicted DNA-binding protein
MYSPKIPESLVPRLYRLAKSQRRPMTRLVAEAVELYLIREETDPITPHDRFTVIKGGAQAPARRAA